MTVLSSATREFERRRFKLCLSPTHGNKYSVHRTIKDYQRRVKCSFSSSTPLRDFYNGHFLSPAISQTIGKLVSHGWLGQVGGHKEAEEKQFILQTYPEARLAPGSRVQV